MSDIIHVTISCLYPIVSDMDRSQGPDYRAGVIRPPHHRSTSPIPLNRYGDDHEGRQVQTRVSWHNPHISQVLSRFSLILE